MNVTTRDAGGIFAIDLEGKLDTQTSTQTLEEILSYLEPNPGKVLLSLNSLAFISSAGLRVILQVAKKVSGYGGALKVSGATGVVKDVMEVSGFDSMLDLYEDEAAAVASF